MESTIIVKVGLDDTKIPETLHWSASNSTKDEMQAAKATMLSFWDREEKTALRIDLWTKDLSVEEMADFYYQTLMGMADTFERATHLGDLSNDLKGFAKKFISKYKEQVVEKNH